MQKLSKEAKEKMSENSEIPFEELIKMNHDDLIDYIENKHGKKMGYSKPDARHFGSGDDSVLIDNDKTSTMGDINEKFDKLLKHHNSSKQQGKTIIEKDQDFYK